nr:MAG TPA: hypothetical protein [Caudoviricetes sp.]
MLKIKFIIRILKFCFIFAESKGNKVVTIKN